MERVIRQKQERGSNNIFLYMGFVSLAMISAYKAPLSFDVPFPGILVFICCLIMHCLINKFFEIRISTISYLLFLRIILFTLNALYLSVNINTILEQIVITFISIMIFEWFRSISVNSTAIIKNILLIFSLLTSIQLIIGFSRNISLDKGEIVAGIGNSNYAATFLLLSVVFLMFIKTKWYEKIIMFIGLVSLLLTQSFGAYIALAVAIIIYIYRKLDWRLVRNWFFLAFLLIVIASIFICFIKTNIGKGVYEKIITKINFLLAGDWKNFGSSRLELYEFSWNNIKRNFCFGSIINYNNSISADYRFQNFRTHNILLESLLIFGLVGTLINLVIYFIIRKYIRKHRSALIYPYIFTIFAAIIHGMIEPNFFTLHFEPFIWMIIGGLMSRNVGKEMSTEANQVLSKLYSEEKIRRNN